MYNTKLVHCCDVVPKLVVEIEIFNFCLFTCFFFANFANGKWSMIKKTALKSRL